MPHPKEDGLDFPTFKAEFIDTQRQWIRFRDSECEAWYVINESE
ncbi:lysozyme inhibitor LprI family protein [Chitinimonas sp. PSY-7]